MREEKRKAPRIRFPGFDGDWGERKLGDQMYIKSRIGWQALTRKEYLESGDYYLITGTDIDEESHTVDLKRCYYVSKERYDMDDKIQVREGDIIVTKDGTIGKVAIVTGLDKPATLNSHLFVLRDLSGTLDNRFLLQILNSHVFDEFVESTKTGSTLTGLPQKTFVEFKFYSPEYDEQKKISEFLTNLDKTITLHQQKLNQIKEYKKGMLQKMFPKKGETVPEVRFPGFEGEWEQRKFSDLVLIERGGSPRPIESFITDAEDGLNWVKIGDAPEMGNYITKTAQKIKPEGLKKTREVHPGDLILSNSMSFGKPYIMAIDGCIHDGWLLIRDSKKVFDLKFLCILLGTDSMLNQYKSMAAGSTVNNLNKELVGGTTVSFPLMEEQVAIGEFLTNLDNTITLHQQKLDQMKEYKKGLLQQMFV